MLTIVMPNKDADVMANSIDPDLCLSRSHLSSTTLYAVHTSLQKDSLMSLFLAIGEPYHLWILSMFC